MSRLDRYTASICADRYKPAKSTIERGKTFDSISKIGIGMLIITVVYLIGKGLS